MVTIKGVHRRRLRLGALSTVTAGVAIGTFAVGGTANGATPVPAADKHAKPTIVPEHGAFAHASSWNDVIEELRADGYPVVAAVNPLRGPGNDAAAPRSVLDLIEEPKILVGHSYGGGPKPAPAQTASHDRAAATATNPADHRK